MKKKIGIIAIALAFLLVVAGCGNSKDEAKDEAKKDTSTSVVVTESTTEPAETVTHDALDNKAAVISTTSDTVEFKVALGYPLMEDAWLGFVPTGTMFKTEAEADEEDFLYVYCSNYDFDGATSYLFEFDKEQIDSIEDGSYDLVLCSSDNEEVGRIMFQIGIDKQGDNLTLDFANEK